MKRIAAIFLLAALCSACTKAPLISQPEQPSPSPTVLMSASPSPLPSSFPISSGTSKPTAPPKPNSSPTTQTFSLTQLPSDYKSDDPRDSKTVDTIVIHSLYNPTASDPYAISSIKKVLDSEEVSSHFVITRDGKVYQLVPENYMAWHAGESTMPAPDGRSKVNYFSIGIELVGKETDSQTDAQYMAVAKLIAQEMNTLPIKYITGHSDIAPGRKTDPWNFDWTRFEKDLKQHTSHSFTILRAH